MLYLAYCIGHAPDISLLLYAKLLRRIRKLEDYYNATLAIISNAATLPKAQLQHLNIIEVVPMLPYPMADFVATVNAWATHTGELPISDRALRTVFPEMDKRPADLLAMHNVHCEYTLLLAVLSTAPELVELGVRKSSCFMCREFILAVQARYRRTSVRVSWCHGKHVAGWSLPVSAPQELSVVVAKRVRDEMEEVLQRATRNRKSDSLPRGSAPTVGVERGRPGGRWIGWWRRRRETGCGR